MKRNKMNFIGLFCAIVFMAGPKCFAVWPASTTLEKSAATSTAPVLERLEKDMRRMEEVMKDLKEDYQELRKSADTTGPGQTTPVPQK